MITKKRLKRWEETLPGAIYRIEILADGSQQLVYVNNNIEPICGYTANELLTGKIKWLNLIVEEDLQQVLERIKPKPENTFSIFEYCIRHKGGKIKTVLNRTLTIWKSGVAKWREGILFDVTDERQKENDLRIQGQFLEWVASTAKIGGWEIDIATMTIHWSDEIYAIRETEKIAEPTVEDALRYYTPESRPLAEKAVREGIEEGKPWDLELSIITAKGNKKWIRDLGVPEMKDGKCVGLRGVLQDITEKKISEIQLLEKEQRLELALEGAALGTWDWNVVTGHVSFNARWAEMLGYTLGEIEPHVSSWEKLVHPDDMPAIMIALELHFKSETNYYETEHRVKHKAGHWIWVLDKGKVVEKDLEGNPIRASGTHLDITQRKSTELQNLKLRQELEQFNTAVSASSIVSIADLKGTIVYANDKFEEISQYKLNELIGQKHSIVNSGFHSREFWKEMWKTVSQGSIWRAEVKNKRKNGTYYWVDTFIMPLRDTENNIIRYLSIRNDITEKKTTEEQLIHALEKAKESDQLKSAFLANMSHEIRTPMNAIMGLTELLERPNFSEEKKHEFAKLIQQRGRDLLNLVNDILDISRIETGLVSSLKVMGNISELFEQLLLAFHAQTFHLQNKDISIHMVNELKTEEGFLMADFIRLNQVLTNLLTNACKFTTLGSIEFGCRFFNGETLQFWVKDTGPGIPTDQFETIFKPFRQANNTIHQQYGGSGLGLAISKGLVELMGGKIWVESKEGTGSTFFFTMPYVRTENQYLLQVLSPRHNWAGKKMLLVEDNEVNAVHVTELLEPTEIEIVHVFTGLEAVSIIDGLNADVAVIDIGLPDMNGCNLARAIKEKFNYLPLIAITASADAETEHECIETGFDCFLTKPVTNAKLLAALEQVFEK